jgi:molybdopterin synthase catalytic subunit
MNLEVTIIDGPLPPASPASVEGAGALLSFEGQVRPTEDSRPIEALDYETYDPMSQLMLTQLAREAIEQHGLLAVRVQHSRGRVPVGACSFRLVVASRHRAQGLAALSGFIDRMKRDVPIWKRPVFRPRGDGR